MYGAYNPPNELGISMHATVNSNASYIQSVQDKTKKQDARFVKLQKVEHAIMESELIKYCLYISMVGILITFVYLLLNMKERLYLEIGIRTIQVWGYVYGLQAWYYKDRDMAKVLVYYLYVSFLLIPCQANYNFAIKSDFWRMLNVILDCFLFFFNILQLILARRLSKNLEERKRLRRELGKF